MARFWRRRGPAPAARTTEERVETVPPPRPRPIWPWLLLLLVVVLGALAASWYFATRDEMVDADRVPDVVGLEQPDAERRLDERGFDAEVKPVDSDRPAGTVIAQRPDAGTLYGEGGIVVISAARSPQEVEIPDVVGLRSGRALVRLRGAGLNPRAQSVRSPRPEGTVVRQIPAAGTEVPRGSAAVVLISAGRRTVDVPDVVGFTADEASARLTRASFRTRIERVTSTEPDGTVIAQRPPGGSRAQAGQVVRLTVSRRRTPTTTTVLTTTTTPARSAVPNTVGQDEATAVSTLQGAGFQVRVLERSVPDPADDGIVIRQSPPGGTSAARGSTVAITVGRVR